MNLLLLIALQTALTNCTDLLYAYIFTLHDPYDEGVNRTDLCIHNCTGANQEICKRLISGIYHTSAIINFRCEAPFGSTGIGPEQVCDSKIDCPMGEDEKFCDEHFYCFRNETVVDWVRRDLVCDGFLDCSNGLDECSNCSRTFLSSDMHLIRWLALHYLIIILAVATIILNFYDIYVQVSKQANKRHLKVDRIILMQATWYDTSMGAYHAGLFSANVYFGSYYFKHDMVWRDSKWCSIIGAVFNLSIHGSLSFIVYLTFTRVYKCLQPFSRGVSVASSVVVSLCIHASTIIHSFIFLVPIKTVQESLFFQIYMSRNNPYLQSNQSTTGNINRIFETYYLSLVTSVTSLIDRAEMLRNITTIPNLFRYVTYSIYSQSPTCVPNMYSSQSLLKAYNIGYVTVVGLLLLFMTVNYIIILFIARKKSKINSNKDSTSKSFLTFKISMIISIKIITWSIIVIPIILFYVAGIVIEDTTYEAIHIMVIPLNSLLNPLFNTSLFQSLICFIQNYSSKLYCCKISNNDEESTDLELNLENIPGNN